MQTTFLTVGRVLLLALGLAGCGRSDSPPTPLAPSPPPPQVTTPAPSPGAFLGGHVLTGVSLSGVVYELTAMGRTPIAGAYVYCEACGGETHQYVLADGNGFYHFSGDIASGGGVWVAAGVPTPIYMGYNTDYELPPGLPASRGPGWRDVFMNGDTRFDIDLVRRVASTP